MTGHEFRRLQDIGFPLLKSIFGALQSRCPSVLSLPGTAALRQEPFSGNVLAIRSIDLSRRDLPTAFLKPSPSHTVSLSLNLATPGAAPRVQRFDVAIYAPQHLAEVLCVETATESRLWYAYTAARDQVTAAHPTDRRMENLAFLQWLRSLEEFGYQTFTGRHIDARDRAIDASAAS